MLVEPQAVLDAAEAELLEQILARDIPAATDIGPRPLDPLQIGAPGDDILPLLLSTTG